MRFDASSATWSDGHSLMFRVGKDPVRSRVLKTRAMLVCRRTVEVKPLTRAHLDTLVSDEDAWTLRLRAGRVATKEVVIAAPVTFRKVLRAMTTFYATRLSKAETQAVERSPPTWNSKSTVQGVHTSDGRELALPAVLPRMSASDVGTEIKTYGDIVRPPAVYVRGFKKGRGSWQPRFT
jgi:hypothetical protein